MLITDVSSILIKLHQKNQENVHIRKLREQTGLLLMNAKIWQENPANSIRNAILTLWSYLLWSKTCAHIRWNTMAQNRWLKAAKERQPLKIAWVHSIATSILLAMILTVRSVQTIFKLARFVKKDHTLPRLTNVFFAVMAVKSVMKQNVFNAWMDSWMPASLAEDKQGAWKSGE